MEEEMEKTRENLHRLIEDFIEVKILNRASLSEDDLNFLLDEAYNYSDSVEDYWPDHKITVTFEPELKDEI